MLTPNQPKPEARESKPVLSVRLNPGEVLRLDWLTEYLNMSRSELVKALVNQEYLAQFGQAGESPAVQEISAYGTYAPGDKL